LSSVSFSSGGVSQTQCVTQKREKLQCATAGFPRTWNKGVQSDVEDMRMDEDRENGHSIASGIVARALAREQALKRGEKPSDEPVVPEAYYERMRGRPPAF